MKYDIDIDEELMKTAIKLSGMEKEKTIEKALNLFIQMENQKKILAYRGKLKWEGDLEQMRLDD